MSYAYDEDRDAEDKGLALTCEEVCHLCGATVEEEGHDPRCPNADECAECRSPFGEWVESLQGYRCPGCAPLSTPGSRMAMGEL